MKKKIAAVEREPYLFNYVNFEAMSSLFGKTTEGRCPENTYKGPNRNQIPLLLP